MKHQHPCTYRVTYTHTPTHAPPPPPPPPTHTHRGRSCVLGLQVQIPPPSPMDLSHAPPPTFFFIYTTTRCLSFFLSKWIEWIVNFTKSVGIQTDSVWSDLSRQWIVNFSKSVGIQTDSVWSDLSRHEVSVSMFPPYVHFGGVVELCSWLWLAVAAWQREKQKGSLLKLFLLHSN